MPGVGIVGCGVISDVYADRLNRFDFLDLVACADLVPERSAGLAKKHSIPKVLETAELLADPDVDVVVNLTQPPDHFGVSKAALEAGKSVFSEKPLAVERADGQALADLAEEKGLRLGCSPDTFLGAGLQTCRKLIDEGAIGEPVAANAFMQSPGPERWHPDPHFLYHYGAGPVFDMAPYYITALVNLLGPVARVTSSARVTHAQREIGSEPMRGTMIDVEVPTHVATVLDFVAGPIGTLVTSFDVQASRYRLIEIYGTEGTLAVPDPNTFGGPVHVRKPGDEDWTEVALSHGNEGQSRGIGLGDMVSAMNSGRAHRASAAQANHVLDCMNGAIEASDLGRHVEIQTTCERPAPLPAGLADGEFDD